MVLKMFTVYDSKAEAYNQPFYCATRGQAIRNFQDTVNDPETMLHKHAEDFTLFEIGEYNDQTGQVKMNLTHESLGLAIQFKETKDEPHTDPTQRSQRTPTPITRQGSSGYNS